MCGNFCLLVVAVGGTYISPHGTKRAGVYALEDEVLLLVHIPDTLLRGRAPGEKDYAVGAHLGHRVNHFLHQLLPALARVRVCLAAAHGQTRIDEQNAPVRPRSQETELVRWLLEVRVILLEGLVDVLERGGSRGGRADGEAETVGLVGAVVGILACDYDLDGVEGCVPRP